jgi:trk system potassium uptake protein TrkA
MTNMRRYMVIGLGRFGQAVAEGLTRAGAEVIGVDRSLALVDAMRDRIAVAVQADSTDADALRAVGGESVDGAIVAIGEGFEAEVLTVAILKELGIKEIIARASNEREQRILDLVGATRTTFVEAEMGHRLAATLAIPGVGAQLPITEDISFVVRKADDRVFGKSVAESGLRARWGLDLIGVKRPKPDGTFSVHVMPPADFHILPRDLLLLVGANTRIQGFAASE